jgi:DNA polymerase-3 subunit beta
VTRSLESAQFTNLAVRGDKNAAGKPERIVVPRKGLAEIRKALEASGDAIVKIDVNEGFFVVDGPSWKLVVRLLDSEFPNYEQVLPKEPGTKISVLSSELHQALKIVSLVVSEKNKGVRLDFFDGLVRISSSSPEVGEGKEEIAVQYKGPSFSIGFNAKYVMDVLASIGEAQPIILELLGETGPGKIYAEADESYVSIVMPLRLD